MSKRIFSPKPLSFATPEPYEARSFDDPVAAVDAIEELYDRNTRFLTDAFTALGTGRP